MKENLEQKYGKGTINTSTDDKVIAQKELEKELLKQYELLRKLKGREDPKKEKIFHKIVEMIMEQKMLVNEKGNIPIKGRKNPYLNRAINIDENYVGYINSITQNRKILPYIIIFPQNMEENSEIIVDTLNYDNTKDPKGVAIKGADTVGGYLRIGVEAPILYIFVPDDRNGKRPYYQQLSRECFTESNLDYQRIDLQVKRTIKEVQNKIFNISNKRVSKKVVLNGYSTSGVFAQRFALIHPEIVSKVIIGAAVGSIPIPTEDLEYPLGIKDFAELFGKGFDTKTYKDIDFAYYVGELEAKEPATNFDIKGNRLEKDEQGKLTNSSQIVPPMHDMSYLPKSIPLKIAEKQRVLYGTDLQTRFKKCIQWYQENGYKIKAKIYKGANHKELFKNDYPFKTNFLRDLYVFYRSGNISTAFYKDDSSADRIDMSYQNKREDENTRNLRITF